MKLYLREYYEEVNLQGIHWEQIGQNPCYDLDKLPSDGMKEEVADFIKSQSSKFGFMTLLNQKTHYHKLCSFLQEYGQNTDSFKDKEADVWMRQLKAWMLLNGIPLTEKYRKPTGKIAYARANLIGYMDAILHFVNQPLDEREKDIWELEKLEIQFRENLIRNFKTLNFTRIPQKGIREEVKRGIYLNLQGEAIATVFKELSAMNRLAKYLADKYPEIQSLKDIDRELFEEYLIYLRTEETSIKYFHSDLTRLRGIMESVGKLCNYENLENLFFNRDIPPVHKPVIKTYSDAELKRLNAGIVEMDEQAARAMVLHQMLGTRISDTLTLQPDCLYERDGNIFIRIRQMKTKTYEKPVSIEVAELVRKAIYYTEQRYGKTDYIFVDRKDPTKPMQYTTLQTKVMAMIYKKDLRDDSGKLFGFGTHMYRHYYGIKLAEMHLDDLTIARLLGHQSVKNVKYYRRMSDQILADETRAARNRISQMIMENLDGWGEEYEQIRYDGSLE